MPKGRIQCMICGRWFKFVNHFHLKTHGITSPQYKEMFQIDYTQCDVMRHEGSEIRKKKSKNTKYIPYQKNEIIEEIKLLSKKREPYALTSAWAEKNAYHLMKQAVSLFGNWKKALQAANIGPKRRRWSKSRINHEIRYLHEKGISLNGQYIYANIRHLYRQAEKIYGSWQNAVVASGLDYEKFREFRTRTPEAVARELKQWCKQNGNISQARLMQSDYSLFRAATERFGSVRLAAEKLNLPFESQIGNWTQEEVVEAILQRISKGKALNTNAVDKDDHELMRAAMNRFGSWQSAIIAAGLEYNEIALVKKQTVESVGRDLIEWCKLNGDLSASKLQKSNCGLYSSVNKYYGSLERAARKLKLTFKPRKHSWTKEEIVKAIKCRAKKGKSLSSREVQMDDSKLFSNAFIHFGNWKIAISESGFNYNSIRKTKKRSSESIVKELKAWVLQHGTLSSGKLGKTKPGLLSAVLRYFGTLKFVAKNYNLPFEEKHRSWSREKVLQEIQERMRLGKSLKNSVVVQEDSGLCAAARKHFSTWEAAIKAAKVNKIKISTKKAA